MSRIIDEALRRMFPNQDRATVSILQLEYLIPKRWTNRLVEVAGEDNDPFHSMEVTLERFLDDKVVLLGFKIID